MITIHGRLADRLGHILHDDVALTASGRGYVRRVGGYAVPAIEYRHAQPSTIRLDLDHDGRRVVGSVRYVEREDDGSLWIVAESTDDDLGRLDSPVYLSPESVSHRDGVELRAVALTLSPATVGARPVEIIDGPLSRAAGHATGATASRLARARRYDRDRLGHRDEPHQIATADDSLRSVRDSVRVEHRDYLSRPIEHSSGGYVLSVR